MRFNDDKKKPIEHYAQPITNNSWQNTNMSSSENEKRGQLSKENELSVIDSILVTGSSLFIVGSVFWVPLLFIKIYKKWKQTPKEDKRRAYYRILFLSLLAVCVIGPHRKPWVGKMLNFRKWRLWKAWLNFVSFQVISEHIQDSAFDLKNDQAILAMSPHGIVPFALGLGFIPQEALDKFGPFRPVVASATRFFPFVRTLIGWGDGVDASRSNVHRALADGSRIGLAPGGISEMFEGYPKKGRQPNDECVLLASRKGFIRMALEHGVPVIPIYCFGSSKMLKRLNLPILERISNLFRISICLFFGNNFLPVPFRKKLLYVIGRAIHPPEHLNSKKVDASVIDDILVDVMHKRFCDEMVRIFDKYKHDYGWGMKTLRIV